jgi:hypothetical protein
MLNDIERKILRIISNYSSGRNRMPTVHQLMIKTGRSQVDVMDVLETLAKQNFIEWHAYDIDNIVLLKAWEDQLMYGSKFNYNAFMN